MEARHAGILAGIDPAGVVVLDVRLLAGGHEGGVDVRVRKRGHDHPAAGVVLLVHVVLRRISAIDRQIRPDQLVHRIVAELRDVVSEGDLVARGVVGAWTDLLSSIPHRVVLEDRRHAPRARPCDEGLVYSRHPVHLVVGDRGLVPVRVGLAGDVAVRIVCHGLLMPVRVGRGQYAMILVVAVVSGVRKRRGRAVDRAHRKLGLRRGYRCHVTGRVVAGKGSEGLNDIPGAVHGVLRLGGHTVEGVVAVDGGIVVGCVRREDALRQRPAGHAPGHVVRVLSPFPGRISRGVRVGHLRLAVHYVIADGGRRPRERVLRAIVGRDLPDQVVVRIEVAVAPDQRAQRELGRLGGALPPEPVEAVVVQVDPIGMWVAARIGGVGRILLPLDQAIGVIGEGRRVSVGVDDGSRQAIGVMDGVLGRVAVGVRRGSERSIRIEGVLRKVAVWVGDLSQVSAAVVREIPLVPTPRGDAGRILLGR